MGPGELTRPFHPDETKLSRQRAAGHKSRTGHDLVGYWGPGQWTGVVKLYYTCCKEA